MTFEEYYKLDESPMRIGEMPEDRNAYYENLEKSQLIKNGAESIGKFENFEIYEFQKTPELIDLYFFVGDRLAAFYSYQKLEQGIRTMLSWNSIYYSGTFRYIFLNYLLDRFLHIKSDYLMSRRGIRFWKQIIRDLPDGYQAYHQMEMKVVPLNDPDEIEDYIFKSSDQKQSFFGIIYL